MDNMTDYYDQTRITPIVKLAATDKTPPLHPTTILDSDLEECKHGGMTDSGERITYGDGMAMREPSIGKGRYDLISPFATKRLAEWLEKGAIKYAPRNWEKGMPFSRYVDSAKRHLEKYIMGMTDEDHLAAICFNIFAIMHHEELGQTHLDDMPHYLKEE